MAAVADQGQTKSLKDLDQDVAGQVHGHRHSWAFLEKRMPRPMKIGLD